MAESIAQSVPQSSPGKQLGALDLGSNSFHLLVAQESQGRIQFLDKHKEMVRLAEGLTEANELREDVIERALACLSRFAERLQPLASENVRVVGTNTLRQVNKATGFIERAEAILGHQIEVISGHEEARLIYLGVCHDLGAEDKHRLVIDIGGGSTELIIGRRYEPEALESLEMGCVSMSARHFADGKITKATMQRAINDSLVELEPVAFELIAHGWHTAVGASGTINAVLSVVSQFKDAPTHITPAGLSQLRDTLIESGHVDNLSLSGLAAERKPVFVGGVAILSAIFDALQITQMSAAQSALREGLIYDLLGRQHEDDARDHTVRSLVARYHIDEQQARQVRETAIGLLSQVAQDWELTRAHHHRLLTWAATLHEIGRGISHSGHHKHGGYLLEFMDMPGFSRTDQKQVATLVRFHRRKLLSDAFTDDDLSLRRLTVLLRVAALLHRNRASGALPHIRATIREGELQLKFPQAWLDEHPLTAVDLENEAGYLASIDIELSAKAAKPAKG